MGEELVDLRLPPLAASAPRARRAVRQAMGALHIPEELLDDLLVALSELVTNALVHAGTPIRVLALDAAGVVRVEVHDGSPHFPRPRRGDDIATTGRGLQLVEQLADRWGADPSDGGKLVWFEMAGPTGEAEAPVSLTQTSRAPDTVAIELRNVPLLLHLAWQEHAAGLLREWLLWQLDSFLDAELSSSDALETHAVASAVLSTCAEQIPRPQVGEDSSAIMVGATEPRVSRDLLRLQVPRAAVADFARLDSLLAEAARLAENGSLLISPTQPEIRMFRGWLCSEVGHQADGAAPRRWRPPVDPAPPSIEGPPGWDPAAVDNSSRVVLAADDSSRILAASDAMLSLLGHADRSTLVGRRLTTLIPLRFQQAHIAGFTLHLSNGRDPLLGHQVTVPVVRADGSEILVKMLVEAEVVGAGRRLFTAELTP